MDLWDLTRLLFRRWYFAVPILLVSALVAFLVARSVEPDYRATGNAVLIPAPGDPGDAEARAQNKPINRPNNPWGDLGFNALGQASILQVMQQETLAKFKAGGLSDSVTVQMDIRSPIFIIEAIGSSPEQATNTVREVIKELSAEVAAQQASYGVMPQDTITTRTLTDGADVETVTSKVKRVLVVVAGLGILLTMAGTIGIDVLLRWRRNRKELEAGAAAVAAGTAPPGGGPSEVGTGTASVTNGAIRPQFVASRTTATSNSEETQIIGRIPSTRASAESGGNAVQLAKPAAGRAAARGSGRSSVRIENGGGSRSTAAAKSDNSADETSTLLPAVSGNGSSNGVNNGDATIILPIPRGQWNRGSDDRNGGR